MISEEKADDISTNSSIDVIKFIMAILVIGIHTEPFGFNFWLDKGFGICTRLCVTYFFTTSAYLFWIKNRSSKLFLFRNIVLYLIWSIIYLPFDLSNLREMTFLQIIKRFLWDGNEHALWYLCGTIIGFIITSILLKFLKPKYILIIAMFMLVLGTLKSTYSNAVYQLTGFSFHNYLGYRNGLYYGFPYIALGMFIAKSNNRGVFKSIKSMYIGFIISFCLLILESYLFVIHFGTDSTILWLSVFPCTYFFFEIVLNKKIQLDKSLSLTIRKMSTLMYVSQFLFIPILNMITSQMLLFILTVLVTILFSIVIIKLSEIRHFEFLKYLY